MPDFDPKLTSVVPNLHIDPKLGQNLNVNPAPQHGGPTPDQWTAMQSAVTALQTANSALTDRVADLEKQMVEVRLVLQGVDPAFATVKQQIADFHTEYSTHQHTLPFGYESMSFLLDTGDNNKPNFLVPYVWEGSNPGLTDFQREQNAEVVGRATSSPKQNPT